MQIAGGVLASIIYKLKKWPLLKSKRLISLCLQLLNFQYGGQAVIEGVMMRGPKSVAVAVRQSGGGIALEKENMLPFTDRYPLFKWPLVRGSFVLVDSLILGIRALSMSANMALEEEEEELTFKEILVTIGVAFILAIVLFILIPTGGVHLVRGLIDGIVIQNIVEGIIRILVFLGYVLAISRVGDIERVFMYHGAEHKTIHTYEKGEELTVENARQHSTLHPRCGTSFLLVVMVISIFVFALLGDGSLAWKVGSRILVLPVVAGLGYEFIKFTARYENHNWVKALIRPGLWLQSLTTREPDDSQLEVAISALNEVLADNNKLG